MQNKPQNLQVFKYEDLVLTNKINEIMENIGSNTEEINNSALPIVKSPISIKGCNAINKIDNNRTMRDANDHISGFP